MKSKKFKKFLIEQKSLGNNGEILVLNNYYNIIQKVFNFIINIINYK